MLGKTKFKYIQSLADKKLRDAAGVFVAEGPKIVRELLEAGNTQLVQLFATTPWLEEHRPPDGEEGAAVEVTMDELKKLTFLHTPHQVLGVFRKPLFGADPSGGITLVLDTLQDPGNFGTIVRTADWFGVRRIVCNPETADIFNPKVVQASMGSLVRVPVEYTTLASYLKSRAGEPSFAATLQGDDLGALPPIREGLLLIGNESRGISPALVALCRQQVRIPRRGQAESLNAAVATGILLAHTGA